MRVCALTNLSNSGCCYTFQARGGIYWYSVGHALNIFLYPSDLFFFFAKMGPATVCNPCTSPGQAVPQ